MIRRFFSQAAFVLVLVASLASAQQGKLSAPVPMPADRVADSYRIYSSLIPVGETAGKGWPHDLWLVQDATIALVQPDQPCRPDPASRNADNGMNPHIAVHPPDDHRQDLMEILEDFDQRCHDRVALDPAAFSVAVPLRLLNAEEQAEFRAMRNGVRGGLLEKFKGAPALYGFSEVYFNKNHTVFWSMPLNTAARYALKGSGSHCNSRMANGNACAGAPHNGCLDRLHHKPDSIGPRTRKSVAMDCRFADHFSQIQYSRGNPTGHSRHRPSNG